jgi:hypothetical protein
VQLVLLDQPVLKVQLVLLVLLDQQVQLLQFQDQLVQLDLLD